MASEWLTMRLRDEKANQQKVVPDVQTKVKKQLVLRDAAPQRVTANVTVKDNNTEGLVSTSPTSAYYSKPNLGTQSDALLSTTIKAERSLTQKAEAYENAQKKLQAVEKSLSFWTEHLEMLKKNYEGSPTQQNMALYNKAYAQHKKLQRQQQEYDLLCKLTYKDYAPALDEYNGAVTKYNAYIGQQKSAYDAWKGTIRDAAAVQADLDAVNAQIETLRTEETQAAAAPKATKPWWQYMAEGLGGVQDTTLPLGAANQQMQGGTVPVSDAMQALLDKKALLQEEYDWSQYFSYADLQQAEDFAENSRYEPQERKEQRALDIMLDNYTNDASGREDPLYEYVNGNQDAGAYIYSQARTSYGHDNPLGALLGTATNGKTESQQMKKEEITIFNYLYKTRGPAAAHEYYDYLQSDLFARQREVDEAYWSQYAKEDPWGSSAFSILTSPMKGLSYLGQAADYMADGTLDQNAGYNKFSYINSKIRESVAQKIEESGKWGKVGSFAYQTGMSMGDFLITTAVAGGNSTLSLAIMGSGAAADTTIAAKDRGLSDGQAFALGTIAGIAEAATERIQIDALLDKTGLGKTAMGYILKNALAEGGEEVASGLINTLADVIIAKDKSQWQKSIDAYMADGKTSEEEAFGKALADQAIAMGLDALGGILSGTAMAGGSAAFSDAGARITGAKLGKQNLDLTDIQTLIDEGLGYEADSRAHYLAQQFQQKLATGKALSDYDIGRLYQANAQAAQESDHETPARTVQEEIERQWRGGQVNQNAVTDVEEALESGAKTTQVAAAEMDVAEIEQQAQRLSKVLGREVVLYSQEATENGIENGYYKDGKIYINTRSGDPVAQIISHELTHSVEFADVYEELSGVVLRRIVGNGTNLAQLRQQTAALYAQNNATLHDNSEIDREIVADYVAKHLLTDEQSIVHLTQAQPSVGRRILEWLDRLLAKLGNADARERAFLSRARNLYSQALGQTRGSFTGETADTVPAEQTDDTTTSKPSDESGLEELKAWMREAYANGDMTDEEFDSMLDLIMEREDLENSAEPAEVKHSFASTKAAGADMDALARAKEMEAQGVALETIHQDTGWHKGKDGMWQFDFENKDADRTKALDASGEIRYNESNDNQGGVNDGRGEMDHSDDRRLSQGNSGGQTSRAAREGESSRGELREQRDSERKSRGSIQNRDSEGRVIDPSILDKLADTNITDSNGSPLAVYHTTDNMEFETFSEGDVGFHFGSKAQATTHGKNRKYTQGRMFRAYLNIKNPVVTQVDIMNWRANASAMLFESQGIISYSEWQEVDGLCSQGLGYSDPAAVRLREILEDKGYDGIIYPNFVEGTGESYIAFHDEQIIRTEVAPFEETGDQHGPQYSISPSTVAKQDVISDLRGILQRGGDPAELRQYVDSLEHNTGNAERNNENTNHNNGFAERDNGFAYQNAETADQILAAARAQGISVEEYLEQNWEQYDVDGQWNAEARKALEQEKNVGRRRYSISKPGNLNDFDAAQRNALLRKKPIQLSRKDWAKVNQARIQRYASLDEADIPEIDVFYIAEYNEVNKGFVYAVRNYDKDSFVPLSKKQIKPKHQEVADKEEHTYGRYTEGQSTGEDNVSNGRTERPGSGRADNFGNRGQLREDAARTGEKEETQQDMDHRYSDVDRGAGGNENVNRQYSISPNPEQALDQEYSGRRRYSISAPEATKNSAPDAANAYQNVNLAEDSEVYNYEFLADLPDMNVVQLPEITVILNAAKDVDKAAVVEQGIKNARSVGTERAGKVYVANRYTGRELRVDVKTIRHGLEGDRNRLLTNGRLASVIGDVIQNAVPVNALYDATNGLEGTYAMAGYATDSKGREFVAIITVEQHSGDVSQIDVFDVAHSVNGRQKRDARPDTKSQGVYPLTYTSKISISDLLSVVKDTFQSILSDDVLSYFNEGRSPWGYYSDRTKFSISGTQDSNRSEVLADEAELLEEEDVTAENSRDALPKKAQDYLKRAERKLLNDIGWKLNVPWLARRDFLQEIVQEISNEYLRTGTVADEVIDRLFDTAYQQGVVVDAEFYNQYRDLKDHVRTLPLTISKQDQSDIADYADFKRRAFGTLRIVNEGGMPVDSAYEELRDMAPELFPDYVTHPADQLQRIYDVARSIRKVEKSLAEFYGEDAAEYKRWARNDFAEAINDVAGELWRVKRFADEKAAADEANSKPPMTVEDAAEAYRKLKDARRAYEKVAAKNLLTEHDELIVGDLLRGKISLENLDPAEDNVKGITAVYEAKLEMEQISKQLADYKQHLRATMRKEADAYLETANEWTDKKVGIAYSRETMRRNVQDIVPDSELAAQINRKYFEPVAVAEAASTRFKEQYRQTVRDLGLSRKVEKGNVVSEAHAVQLLGEAMDNVTQINNARGRLQHRDGKTLSEWQDVIGNLWKENPHLDQNKIKNAVEAFRKIYDDLFQQMNRVRVANGYEPVNYRNGYFPHFQPGDGDGILAHFGRILGIDTSVAALPTTINGLTHTFKPGIQWFGNAQERLGFNTAYDAIEGFDKYIEGVASVIHQTQNIQNLRALASQIRYRTSDEGIRKQVDAVYENTRLTEEEKQVQIAGIYERGRYTLSNFVVELDEYTNLLANKKSKLDRTIEALMGRRCYTILKWWEGRVGANMIAGNPSSALTNFIPLTQSAAQIGNRNLLAGMWNTLKAYKDSDGIVELSTFLTNRRGSDPLVKTWAEKASKVAGKPMEWIDTFVSDSIVRGAYYRNLKQGMSEAEALYQADVFAANVMADRSKGAMPTLFSSTNPLFKAFTQFQLEVNNQFSEVFKDLPRGFKEKGLGVLAGVLFKYFLGAWLFNELYEYLFGRRPALDPIGILNETVGDLSGYELPNLLELGVGAVTGDMPSFETEKVGIGEAAKNLSGNLLEELPFSSGLTLLGIETDGGRIPASSAVPDLTALWDAATTEGWSWQKRTKEAWDEISKPLTYIVPPFGGNQLQKIWKGLAAYFRGGSYTVDKDGNDILQYPVYNDAPEDAFWNAVRAAIMGKSSLPEAQEWVDSGFDSLSAKQTAAYQDMQAAGVADRDAYALLMELQNAVKTDAMSKTAVQREILRQSDVSGEGVAIAYYGLVASDADRELMDRLTDLGAEPGETVKLVMDLRETSGLKGLEKKQTQRDLIAAAAITDEEKSAVMESILGSDLLDEKGNPSQYAKFLCTLETGLSVDEYLDLYSNGTDVDKYFEFTDAGVDPQEAKKLVISLEGLEPSAGADEVAAVQKWRATVDGVEDAADQLAALSAVMTAAQHAKAEIAYNFEVTPDVYVSMQELLPKYDADGNGSYKQAEITAAINAMGGSTQQKAVLWQLATGSTSAKNNPYSAAIGNQVIAARQKAKEEAEEDEPRTISEEIMRQLTGGK